MRKFIFFPMGKKFFIGFSIMSFHSIVSNLSFHSSLYPLNVVQSRNAAVCYKFQKRICIKNNFPSLKKNELDVHLALEVCKVQSDGNRYVDIYMPIGAVNGYYVKEVFKKRFLDPDSGKAVGLLKRRCK
jgi:uncharacterized protein YerC